MKLATSTTPRDLTLRPVRDQLKALTKLYEVLSERNSWDGNWDDGTMFQVFHDVDVMGDLIAAADVSLKYDTVYCCGNMVVNDGKPLLKSCAWNDDKRDFTIHLIYSRRDDYAWQIFVTGKSISTIYDVNTEPCIIGSNLKPIKCELGELENTFRWVTDIIYRIAEQR